MMTDPIADLLTRIRNANKALMGTVAIPHSRYKEEITRVLKEEGYIKGYEVMGEGVRRSLVVSLKYLSGKERAIEGLDRVSKPGKRVYVGHDEIKAGRGRIGMAILSTPRGVLTEAEARRQKVGGEWICTVW
jgi:small subunit ribosomal protein S8